MFRRSGHDVLQVTPADLGNVAADPPVRLRGQTEFPERLKDLGVGAEMDAFAGADGIEHRAERPFRHQARIELFKRARSGVARVGKRLFARRFQPRVHCVEVLLRNVSLAADLEQRGRRVELQFVRNAANLQEVGGNVIALTAVAACDAQCKFAVSVMETDRNAVHLGLEDILDGGAAKLLLERGVKSREFGERVFVLEAVALGIVRFPVPGGVIRRLNFVEREHRLEVLDALELRQRFGANTLGGRVRRNQIGILLFDGLELVLESVVIKIADDRAPRRIGVIVPANIPHEFGMSCFGLRVCHFRS